MNLIVQQLNSKSIPFKKVGKSDEKLTTCKNKKNTLPYSHHNFLVYWRSRSASTSTFLSNQFDIKKLLSNREVIIKLMFCVGQIELVPTWSSLRSDTGQKKTLLIAVEVLKRWEVFIISLCYESNSVDIKVQLCSWMARCSFRAPCI